MRSLEGSGAGRRNAQMLCVTHHKKKGLLDFCKLLMELGPHTIPNRIPDHVRLLGRRNELNQLLHDGLPGIPLLDAFKANLLPHSERIQLGRIELEHAELGSVDSEQICCQKLAYDVLDLVCDACSRVGRLLNDQTRPAVDRARSIFATADSIIKADVMNCLHMLSLLVTWCGTLERKTTCAILDKYTVFPTVMSAATSQSLENLRPSIWRASQLGRATTRCIDTGHLPLSNQLAGGGWPTGAVIELLVQQPGVGEMRLVGPALAKVAHRKVVLIQPPHTPHTAALATLGVAPENLIWVKSKTSADMLWAAEQVLRSGSVGAVMMWTTQIRQESLRRLNLAAQTGETLLWVLRPLAAALDASPSPLRLSVRPAPGGIEVGFVKRRGPQRDEPLLLPLAGPLTVSRPRATPAPAKEVLTEISGHEVHSVLQN